MSHNLVFNILPFDPRNTQKAEIPLPVEPQNLADTLRANWPKGDIQTYTKDNETEIRFYINSKKYGTWLVAHYDESFGGCFFVSGWPKTLATELIRWYRKYIPHEFPLFVVVVESGKIYELTPSTTIEDVHAMYPYSVDENWEW